MRYQIVLTGTKYNLAIREDGRRFVVASIEEPVEHFSEIFCCSSIWDLMLDEIAHNHGIEDNSPTVLAGEFVGTHDGAFYLCRVLSIEKMDEFDETLHRVDLEVNRIEDCFITQKIIAEA